VNLGQGRVRVMILQIFRNVREDEYSRRHNQGVIFILKLNGLHRNSKNLRRYSFSYVAAIVEKEMAEA
jgi:hypothetical protein